MFICVFSPCFSLSLRCVSFTDPHMTQVLVLVIFLVVLYPVSLTPVSGLAPASFCLHWFTCSLSVLLNVGPKVSDLRSISPDAGIECCDFPLPAMGTSVFVEMSWRSGCSMWTFVISWVGRVRCPSLDATRLFSLLVHTSGLGTWIPPIVFIQNSLIPLHGWQVLVFQLCLGFLPYFSPLSSVCMGARKGAVGASISPILCFSHLLSSLLLGGLEEDALAREAAPCRGGCSGQGRLLRAGMGGWSMQGTMLFPREAALSRGVALSRTGSSVSL